MKTDFQCWMESSTYSSIRIDLVWMLAEAVGVSLSPNSDQLGPSPGIRVFGRHDFESDALRVSGSLHQGLGFFCSIQARIVGSLFIMA